MLATLQAKLITGGIVFAILLALFFWGKGVLNERSELRTWQSNVTMVTRTASGNQKLVEKDVVNQVKILGESILNFKKSIAVQNEAIASLSEKSKEAIAARDREAALRKEVIVQSQSLARKLQNEAMTPVEREKLEAELRRVQNLAWEAGL